VIFQKKVSTLLQRRGFSYEVVRSTVRRLIEELDANDPEYFAGDQDDNENEATDPME